MEPGIAALSFPFSSAELVSERAGYGDARRSFCIDESVRFPFGSEKILPPLSDRFSALIGCE